MEQNEAGTERGPGFPPEQDEELRYYLAGAEAREAYAALLAEARAAEQTRDLDQAAECCRRALALRPTDRDALELLAEVRIAQGRSSAEVVGLFQGACRREPALAWDLMGGLADLWEQHGEPAEAESALRWACGFVPHDPLVHLGLAGYLASAGRLLEAEVVLRTAVAAVGAHPELWAHLAQVLVVRGSYGEAAQIAAEIAATGDQLPPELSAVRAAIEVHAQALSHLDDLLQGRAVAAEVATHTQECVVCRALLRKRRQFAAVLVSAVLLAVGGVAALGPSAEPILSGAATTDGRPVRLELSVDPHGELLEVRFRPSVPPAPPPAGRWAVEVSLPTPHGPYPLGVALLADGVVLLPAAVGERRLDPAELQWRAVAEDELLGGPTEVDGRPTTP